MFKRMFVALTVLGALPALVSAVPIEVDFGGASSISGFRVTDLDETQIVATDGWAYSALGGGGFKVAWTITWNDATENYTYHYDFTDAAGGVLVKGVSHAILEISDLDALIEGTGLTITKNTWTSFSGSPSNPGMPTPLADTFAVKLEPGASSYEFTSDRAPMWGDFYIKDGDYSPGPHEPKIDVLAYNAGFAIDPTDASSPFGAWIAVPDTSGGKPPSDITVIPEPTTVLLVGLGLVGLVFRRKRKS